MRKILSFLGNNIFLLATLFLIAFIPLYPKIPLINVRNTWVYVRAEDFVVVSVLFIWFLSFLFKRVNLKTPLTLPIFIFWIIGGLSTLHGVLLLFPTLSNVFSNVAFLSMLRRIEYLSLFFVAFTSMKDKRFIYYVVFTLTAVLLLVVAYGFGQKFLGFPAYLTMNEEFAKGIPIQLSLLSRVPSTFAGHYDLAAYLVLVIPLLVSLTFGFKKWWIKISLLTSAALGFALLFMTVSRVSFFVLLISLVTLLLFQKKKLIILSLLLLTFVFLILSPTLLQRFGNTVSEVNVLVNARTGEAIGQVREVPKEYFKDKLILRQFISAKDAQQASASAILPYQLIPPSVQLLVEANNPTGENLPQGTSYINLPLSPIIKRTDQYFFEKADDQQNSKQKEVKVFDGEYLIKRARAYDLSFTTRFQGEWPRTIASFKRNIFLGSGYGSVSLAVDNNYLRILGESGLFGFMAFASIFLISGIYIKKILPKVDSAVVKSFVLGFVAGSFGLALNALLIDVFEASKIAFTYWMLMGITIGILHLYKETDIDLFKEFKNIITSPYAIGIAIFILAVTFFSPLYTNYFVGDDFTWLKWVADSKNGFLNYFTDANGFFYRPGAKIYFSLMYSIFWLNQSVYHFISIFLHFIVALLIFVVCRKIFKNYILSILTTILFLVLSGHHEAIFWISATGFLFNAVFALLSLLFFIYWKENKKRFYFFMSLLSIVFSLLFHEIGVVVPLLIILYDIVISSRSNQSKKTYLILFSPLLPYAVLRFVAQSHWLSGDYSYSMLKLPFNFIGNTIGYIFLDLLGPQSLPLYDKFRNFLKGHMILALPIFILIIVAAFYSYRLIMQKLNSEEKKIVIFGLLFFAIALLPFLGLGNITSRYSYLSSIGFVIILTLFIKKSYEYILSISDKYTAVAGFIIIAMIFSSTQLFQLQRIHSDWQEAGEKSKKFLFSLQSIYRDYWRKDDMQFYFVNVPIKNGGAWIFPVGLSDALWFTFKNENLKVYETTDLKFALDQAEGSSRANVFQFDQNGGVLSEVTRVRNEISITPVNKR